ncbi:MAG: tetratricopeptide repeat protein [Nannocystaceae bacterium]|nr:tetratricopeptide repeat protein [bacterium]
MGQGPAVGNVLGVALLCRDHKALLCLEQRTLREGLRVRGYEAEVYGIEFPMRAPTSPSALRNRRSDAVALELEADAELVQQWVDARLEGLEVAGMRIRRASFGFDVPLGPDHRGPALTIEGHAAGGRWGWLRIAVEPDARGRHIAVKQGPTWVFGLSPSLAKPLWSALMRALFRDDAHAVDPVRETLGRALVASGWKAPRLDRLSLLHAEFGARAVRLAFGERDGARPITPHDSAAAADIAAEASEVSALADAGDPAAATEHAAALASRLAFCPDASAAAWQWATRLGFRVALRDDALVPLVETALEQWSRAQPTLPLLHRMRFELRARSGDHAAILHDLEGHVGIRARLARAALLLRRLGNTDAAREELEALGERRGSADALGGLQRDAAWLSALAHADDPALARSHLQDARRGDLSDADRVAEVADALLRAGHSRVALDTATEALVHAPSHVGLLRVAQRAAYTAHDGPAAFDHARKLLAAAPDAVDTPEFRRLLARLSVQLQHADAVVYVSAALEDSPDDPELLRDAASLYRARGNVDAALATYRALRSALPPSGERARVRLEEAVLLDDLEQDASAVWEVLWPALGKLPRNEQRRGFGLAVEVAPAGEVEAWVRRLRTRVDLESAIRALHRRWLRNKVPDAATVALYDALSHAGATAEALALAKDAAAASTGRAQADWLTRAAARTEGAAAAALLDAALRAAPDDDALADRLVALLDRAGQDADLTDLWRSRAADVSLAPAIRLDAIDRFLQRALSDQRDPRRAAAEDPEIAQLYASRLALDPDDPTAHLIAADLARSTGDESQAAEHWAQAIALMAPEDPRVGPAGRSLGAHHLASGNPEAAVSSLRSAAKADPESAIGWAKLAEAATIVGDDALCVHARESQLAHTPNTAARGDLMLELSRLQRRRGQLDSSVRWLERASGHIAKDSTRHAELAEAWMEIAREAEASPQQQLLARAEVRGLLGGNQPSAEYRAEARLLAEAGRIDDALRCLDEALERTPSDELLLSSMRELATEHDRPGRYDEALDRAIATLPEGDTRDSLLTERATIALQAGNATAALEALDRLRDATADRPELLDLRDWAVHELGREDEELRRVGDGLRVAPADARLLERLRRLLAGDEAAMSEHLLGLAQGAERDAGTALTLRALALALQTGDGAVLRRAVRRAHDIAPRDLRVRDAWHSAVEQAFLDDDAEGLCDLLDIRLSHHGTEDLEIIDEELDRGLVSYPRTSRLHRVLRSRHSTGDDTDMDAMRWRIDALASRIETEGRNPVDLYVGFASQLDRADAAALLQQYARDHKDDPNTLRALGEALAERGHIAEQLEVLELAVEHAPDSEASVTALKQLAHVASDRVGDHLRAMRYLERAVEFAPHDPDLLLPLLEHVFEQRALGPILEYTHCVLDYVEMGNAGYITLAHRAADAALARGDHDSALALVERAHKRDPDHTTTRTRLDELRTLAEDPMHRAALLEQVAQRQHGEARLDAIEERARLLAGPLDRPREAIRELTAVLREDPRRPVAREALAELLEAQGDWRELVELHERHVAHVYGLERCTLLRTISQICRTQLRDLQRSEQALRIALEHLGDEDAPEARALAEQMRAELVRDLEGQGRYVDLAIYLERSLAHELEGVPSEDLSPERAGLLVELARIYRGPLDDEAKASRVYERLELYGHLPDEGLATLARAYQRAGRHEDLVRILKVRFEALSDDPQRGAAVAIHIAQLLESPLGRPHEAARYYLDAYLASPSVHQESGTKAKVLLSGTDAVVRVRAELIDRLGTVADAHRPALLTLLGDLLSVHDEYEAEAEAHYRDALDLDPDNAAASEALGRLMARQGRLDEAVPALVAAACHVELDPARAAETAAVAARVLLELDRPDEAEEVLKTALQRAPESQRALLELARLYERSGRTTEQAIVLENLSQLPLSSMLGAEVAYRRAALLLPATGIDPYSAEAERARAYLLEAVGADAKHVAARQALMELARQRLEWSVVAHMHYLAIRELPDGPARAAHHLDLAETYIDHLHDVDSAVRNIESAITQAPDDLVISSRAATLTSRLPNPRRIADRLERIASTQSDLDDAARARLWLLAADLRMSDDDVVAAEAATQRVLALSDASDDLTAAAQRNLDALEGDDRHTLRKQKSGLLRLLEVEHQPTERVHILARLRELGHALGDPDLESWAGQEQLDLATSLDGSEEDMHAAAAALRDAYAERGAYAEVVSLYERVAERSTGNARAKALLESARFAWTALRDPGRALESLQRSVEASTTDPDALALLSELTAQTGDDPRVVRVYDALRATPHELRTPSFDLEFAQVAADLGRTQDAVAILRPLCLRTDDLELRFTALTRLDAVLAAGGSPSDRVAITRRLFEASLQRRSARMVDVALDLARCERTLGGPERGIAVLAQALEVDPTHTEMLGLYAELLEETEDWATLGDTRLQIASLSSDPIDQAEHYMAAAQAFIDQGTAQRGNRPAALARARAALQRATETAPTLPGPSVRLLPLAFAESRWDEVLDLAVDIRARSGPDEEVLLLAALTEAYRHGQRSLARDLGFRHGPAAQERYLFPGLRQLLTQVATKGPLPRLDAVLAAAGSLLGGRVALSRDLSHWSSGQPLQAGLALGLARLAEAAGQAERARNLYQVTAFMVPDGPVPSLVARLPVAAAPTDSSRLNAGPFEAGGTLRRALASARHALAGFTKAPSAAATPTSTGAKARLALAESIVEPWRHGLDCELPLAWTRARLPGGVGVANRDQPTILLGAGVTICSVAELRFRLARAATSIASGLAILEEGHGIRIDELLDGLGRMASPSHVPTRRVARDVAEALTAASISLSPREGAQLGRELAHWLTSTGGVERLEVELRRAVLLFATRLSGQLDGALLTLAHDRGFVGNGRPDPVATLRYEDAYWLLRALEMY